MVVHYLNNRPSCVTWETSSTIIDSLATVKASIRPNVFAASVCHVTTGQYVYISVCPTMMNRFVVELPVSAFDIATDLEPVELLIPDEILTLLFILSSSTINEWCTSFSSASKNKK